MSSYVHGTSLSYRDYLQAKSIEDNICHEINHNTRTIIASNQQLQQQNISVYSREQKVQREQLDRQIDATYRLAQATAQGFDRLAGEMDAGFDRVVYALDDIKDGICELNASFDWGFSQLIATMGTMNHSIEILIKCAKSPTQTWAYEQYEVSRDAFRQELYEESLEYVNRAINGFGSNTGYMLDHRFHFLLGLIHLPDKTKKPESIASLFKAEKAFASASKYARRDDPKDASRALVSAGWAAYCQGNMAVAQNHLKDAIALNQEMGEAYFLLAKTLMHIDQPDDALIPLRAAIVLDRDYSIKAGCDGDFQTHQTKLDALFESLREEAKILAVSRLLAYTDRYNKATKTTVENYDLGDASRFRTTAATIVRCNSIMKTNTYYGYLDVVELCFKGQIFLSDEIQQFLEYAKANCSKRITDAANAEKCNRDSKKKVNNTHLIGVFAIFGFFISFIIGVASCNSVKNDGCGIWFSIVFCGTIASAVIGGITSFIRTEDQKRQLDLQYDQILLDSRNLNDVMKRLSELKL